jgi:SNF2 family DNA or RNA helicase
MRYEPHKYQSYATRFIIENPIAGLLIGMGMGKTVITLTAVKELMHDRFDIAKTLIIAPLRVAEDTWGREASKWEHLEGLRISKVLGDVKERKKALHAPSDIYIINRENVGWIVDLYGKDWPFDMVIIDELSSFKSAKAQRFKALRKIRPVVKRIVGLTGTPAPNGLIDLWPQIYLLDQGERLGKTITGYRERYFEPDKRNRTVIFSWKPKAEAEQAIYKKISDICISMNSEDWLELPERINNIIPVPLPEKAKEKYLKLEYELLLPLADGDVVAGTAAVLANKLLQMANGAVYDENGKVKEIHDAKLKALDDILEAANGNPVLIFYTYRHDLQRMKDYLKSYEPRELKRPEDISDWNSGRVQVMIAHPASAGHGLNLQAGGNIIVWFGLTWSLELYQQANARLHRQGQEKGVVVNHLVAKGTMDEQVIRVLENKVSGQDALLDAVKARIENIHERGGA